MSVSLFNFGSAINYYFYSLNYLKEQIFITIFRTIPIFLVPSILHEQYGLASVGIGILIGEIFSSVILPIILFYSDIKKNHYRTNISEFLKRFIPTIFFCFVSFCIIYKPDQILNISIIGFILLVSVYYVTWFFLPLELKKRVHLVFYKNR